MVTNLLEVPKHHFIDSPLFDMGVSR